MFPAKRGSRNKVFAVGIAVLCISRPGWADTLWQGTTGDWFDPANWSVEIPTASDDADINNGGTAQISAGENAVAASLTLGQGISQPGSLSLTGGTLTAPTINVNAGGNFNITNIDSVFGTPYGTLSCNEFNLNGGTATFVTVNVNNGAIIPVVTTPPGISQPAFNLSSGTVTALDMSVASSTGTTFVQPSNITLQSGELDVNANYSLPMGTLLGEWEIVQANATITQSGGTNSLGNQGLAVENVGLMLGYKPSAVSSYVLSGGSLNVAVPGNGPKTGILGGDLPPGGECVGFSGTGTFIQTGGTNTLTSASGSVNDLILGYTAAGGIAFGGSPTAGVGTYALSGGTLAMVGGGTEFVGYNGTGTFIQTGGTNSLVSISGPGDAIYIGYTYGSGTYLLEGGDIEANPGKETGVEYIGYYTTGTFLQTGGNNNVDKLILGNDNPLVNPTISANGTYNLQDGTLTTRVEFVGYYGMGSFMQRGGTNTLGTLVLSLNGAGTYSMTGGTLTVLNRIDIFSGSAPGTLEIQGGSATTPTVNNNAGIVALTGAAGSNTYGSLTVTGDYTQLSGSELNIGVGGDPDTGEFGLLSVGGMAALDGTLDVSFLNGFSPTFGQTFDFLSAGGISGQFAAVDSPYTLQMNYTDTGVSFTVVPEPSAIGLLAIGTGLLLRRRPRR